MAWTRSRSSVSASLSSFGSRSMTNAPTAFPVGTPIIARGQRFHHPVITDSSVVASLNPCLISGRLSFGSHGKTGHPRRAYCNANASMRTVHPLSWTCQPNAGRPPPVNEYGKSERDIVVQIGPAPAARRLAAGGRLRRPARARSADASPVIVARLAVQHHQLAVVWSQHDFRRVSVVVVLVGPFAGLQLAADVNLAALSQILFRDADESLIPDHHAMPFGVFLALAAVLVFPAFRRGDAERTHLIAAAGV